MSDKPDKPDSGFVNFDWMSYAKHIDEISPEDQEEALDLAQKLKFFWETSAVLPQEQVTQEREEAVAIHNRLNELGFVVTTNCRMEIDEKSDEFKVVATVNLLTAKHKTGPIN